MAKKDAKKEAPKEAAAYDDDNVPVTPSLPGLPVYWYVYPIVVAWLSLLYFSGYGWYFAVYFMIQSFLCPFVSWPRAIKLGLRSLRPYPGFDYYANLNGFAVVLSRFLLSWPFETALWYLDDILFPASRKVKIVKPLFVIGQPRSGTTKLESILAKDDRLLTLTLFEMRFPYLTVLYFKDFVANIDRKYLGGAIKSFIFRNNLNYFMKPNGFSNKMRPLAFERPDEDDTMFLFHQSMHFTLIAPFPSVDSVREYYHFDHLPLSEQLRMMRFHHRAVQKIMYYRGEGKVYFSKWVGGWNGQLDIAEKYIYPDAQYLCIVREPSQSLPSWMRLQSYLSLDFTGLDILSHPGILREVKKENRIWFENQVKFCQSLPPGRLLTFSSEGYYEDILKSTRALYKHLGLEIKPEFEEFLRKEQLAQKAHVPTETDERHITQEEIRRDFPDLPRLLLQSGKTTVVDLKKA